MPEITSLESINHMQEENVNPNRMEFPILNNWTSPFPFEGLLGGIFFNFI